MDYTTVRPPSRPVADADTLPLVSLYEALQQLPDPRRAQGKRYSLALVLCLLLLAKLAGQKTLSGATEWIGHRRLTLAERFGLKGSSMPCQMTYCNVLALIDGHHLDEILSACFERWEAASAGVETNPAACRPPKQKPIIAIWLVMAKRCGLPAPRPMRSISSVVMR